MLNSLQELAWNLMGTEQTQFTPRQCQAWIADVLQRCTKSRRFLPANFLKEMTDIAGLVVEKERDIYEFSHQTFQEYLAAKYLRELPDGEMLIKTRLTRGRWQEVVCFYAALGNATALVAALLVLKPYEVSLRLARRCIDECREIDQSVTAKVKQAIDDYVVQHPLSSLAELQGALKLQQRFKPQPTLSETITISPEPITWSEYKLFLDDQQAGQFHSWAEVVEIAPSVERQPVTGIKWADARWFCAWLSTQTALQQDEQVFDYRLPTPAEMANMQGHWGSLTPFTTEAEKPGTTLVVVRQTLPERYAALINYLANGRWRDADEETYRIMKEVAGGRLTSKALREFPCEDLHILDQLWIKHSGGKFGFSVQKQIYVETGNPLDGQYHKKTWYAFADCVGWRKDGDDLNYSDLKGNPSLSPCGEFPLWRVWGGGGGWLDWGVGGWVLFSRTETCEL